MRNRVICSSHKALETHTDQPGAELVPFPVLWRHRVCMPNQVIWCSRPAPETHRNQPGAESVSSVGVDGAQGLYAEPSHFGVCSISGYRQYGDYRHGCSHCAFPFVIPGPPSNARSSNRDRSPMNLLDDSPKEKLRLLSMWRCGPLSRTVSTTTLEPRHLSSARQNSARCPHLLRLPPD
jgi:hypothetical protein